MNRLTSLLVAALALQLLLAVALFWPRENPGEIDARAALLELAAGEVDRLIISTAADSLLLHRGDEGWILPDYHKLPVQESRVNRVLLDLPALSRGWPIAGSANAAARFQVADEEFQRRVSFYAGEQNRGELFVGTSPGFRKVHVRPAGDEKVYAVEFNSFELPVNADEWLDKTLLQVRDLTRIEGLDYRLELDGDRWLGDAGQEANTESVDALLSGLGSLRINGAADIATASILAQLDAPPTLSVSAAGGNYQFRLYEMEDSYFIQREDIPVYFSLSAYDYDRLNDVNAEALFAAGDGEEAEDDDAGE